jgi:hypothetical protein
VTPVDLHALAERLFRILTSRDFLEMRGLANEVPIFIQAYEPAQEAGVRLLVDGLTSRIRSKGLVVKKLDLFDLVLEELEEHDLLDAIMENEASWEKVELFETLRNYSDPKTHLIPRLMRAIGDDTQITLLTGAGRVYPFLRTHTILESLQPAMLPHPVVMFFPGEYTQELGDGSQLRLFGTHPSPRIHNPYYRALNLDHYRLADTR